MKSFFDLRHILSGWPTFQAPRSSFLDASLCSPPVEPWDINIQILKYLFSFDLLVSGSKAKEDNFITGEILMTPPNSEERGLCPSSSKSSLPSCQTDPTTPRTAKVINICVWETRKSNTMSYVFPMTLTPVTGTLMSDTMVRSVLSTTRSLSSLVKAWW